MKETAKTYKVTNSGILRQLLDRLPGLKLSHRTTLYFFIFGIMIGYLSFVIFIMITTRNYISLASDTALKHFEKIYTSSESDVLLKMIQNPNKEVLEEVTRLKNAASQFHDIKNVRVIYRRKKTKIWETIFRADEKGQNRLSRIIISKNEIYKLNHAEKRNISASSPFFFGRKDAITIYINISRKIDTNRYILALTVNRQGLLTMLKEHFNQYIIFNAILFICSMLLGKIFANMLTKPIKTLSHASKQIASGDLRYRFKLERRDEIGILAGSLDVMAENLEQHILEIERRMQAMETMNRIDKTVLSSISRNDLLDKVVTIVSSFFTQTSIIMTLYNREINGYDILAFKDHDLNLLLGENPHVSEKELSPEMSELIKSTGQIKASKLYHTLPEALQSLKKSGFKYILNVPIHISDQLPGSLVLGTRSESPFSDEEIETAGMIADQVGVALDSVRTFEEKERLLLGILMALTSSIDAKSRWTAGHSERVARYAELLASRLQLSQEEVRDVTISAILHDIGKISVPETILDKPGKLTTEEYDIIKNHPEKGAEIIEKISAYDRMLPGILYHHERWDGNGYPFGLKGKQIPLIGRIITIADVYEAITDDRPYRKGLTDEEAFQFLEENKEKIFDPELVDIFINTRKVTIPKEN